MKHNIIYLYLLLTATLLVVFVSGCLEIDSDGDGYNDKIDAFPNDAQYNHDLDEDGYADEIDDFPNDPEYHETCPECNGLGTVTYIDETQEPFIGADSIDAGFEDDYYYMVLYNNDPVVHQGGNFTALYKTEGHAYYQTAYIEPGETHTFKFYYDSTDYILEGAGNAQGHENAINPLYKQELTKECPYCNGTGKI